MMKLKIKLYFVLRISNLLADIFYLLFYHHVSMIVTYFLVASIIIPFIFFSKWVLYRRKEIEKIKEIKDSDKLTICQ